ncbi:hypothetical protein GF322_04965 [Candidatus Dependentiae bacterium]|nr:hypothetical protein [Candidatus Dependentiae bacterium]
MKSMLQEAATVFKAIEKAWLSCGKPDKFTVKVLEYEDKNFWGLTKKPAVISFTYDSNELKEKTVYDFKAKTQNKNINRFVKNDLYKENKTKSAKTERYLDEKKEQLKKKNISERFWTKEIVHDVLSYLKDLIGILGVKISIKYKIDQKILNIYFDKKILNETDDEKIFYISLSHIIMQFLKKKYKKKFKNYYLIINMESTGINDL